MWQLNLLELNFHTTEDAEVFKKASLYPSVIVITTKDYDFVKISNEPGGRRQAKSFVSQYW